MACKRSSVQVRYPPLQRHSKPPSGGFFYAPKSFNTNDLACFRWRDPFVVVECSVGFCVGFGVGFGIV